LCVRQFQKQTTKFSLKIVSSKYVLILNGYGKP
jgi:hypothetical protein